MEHQTCDLEPSILGAELSMLSVLPGRLNVVLVPFAVCIGFVIGVNTSISESIKTFSMSDSI